MAKGASGHLDEERIIEAVLDEAGLDKTARRHLIECEACRGRKETLENRLVQFGQMSRKFTPAPLRRPRLAVSEFGVFKPHWRIRPSIGMGVAIASILALLLSPLPFRDKQVRVYSLQAVYSEMARDETFMTEIDGLVENPLPNFYVEISDPSGNIKDTETTLPPPGGAG